MHILRAAALSFSFSAAALFAQSAPSPCVVPPNAPPPPVIVLPNMESPSCIYSTCSLMGQQWQISLYLDFQCLKTALGTGPTTISGRYVRVQLISVGYLALAEVQVYAPSGTADIALNAPATQSSTYAGNGGAGLADDGNTDGVYGDGSVSHTGGTEAGWLSIDLGMPQPIGSIVIWNRTDLGCADQPGGNCGLRLSNYVVSVSNNADGSLPVWSSVQTTAPNPSTTIAVQ